MNQSLVQPYPIVSEFASLVIRNVPQPPLTVIRIRHPQFSICIEVQEFNSVCIHYVDPSLLISLLFK